MCAVAKSSMCAEMANTGLYTLKLPVSLFWTTASPWLFSCVRAKAESATFTLLKAHPCRKNDFQHWTRLRLLGADPRRRRCRRHREYFTNYEMSSYCRLHIPRTFSLLCSCGPFCSNPNSWPTVAGKRSFLDLISIIYITRVCKLFLVVPNIISTSF